MQLQLLSPDRKQTLCSARRSSRVSCRDLPGVYMNGATHGASNGAVLTAPRDAAPRDPVAELMEQVATGRVRPMDAAAQVCRAWGQR